MKPVRYLDEARAEFLHEVQYFSAVSPGLGKRFDEAVQKAEAPLPQLKTAPQAAIINIGGLTAHTGAANRVHVVTTRARLVGMTRALAHDLAAHGITVNCVAPGLIDAVRQSGSASAAPKHHATHKALLGRRGAAQEVAQSVRFLAGDEARFITGQVLHVNGGTYLGGGAGPCGPGWQLSLDHAEPARASTGDVNSELVQPDRLAPRCSCPAFGM